LGGKITKYLRHIKIYYALVEKIINNDITGLKDGYDNEFKKIKKRCLELTEQYPEDKNLFFEYVERQKREYEILSDEIIPAIFVIKKKYKKNN
jgi:hypothetical protein